MTDTPPKPKRGRWRWLVIGAALVTSAIIYNSVASLLHRRQWAASVELLGLEVWTVSPFERWASGYLDMAKHVVEGSFLIVWVQDQEQADQLLNGRSDCPRGTMVFVSNDLPDEVLTAISTKFPPALVSREPEPERAPEDHVI